MTGWSEQELHQMGAATELELAPRRQDDSLGRFTTMWVVRVGDDLYTRSAGGPDRCWYKRALASGDGRVRAGGIEADALFTDARDAPQEAIDAAYHHKYDRYGPGPVGHVTGAAAHPVTIRLDRSSS
jgi:hypothetical protein